MQQSSRQIKTLIMTTMDKNDISGIVLVPYDHLSPEALRSLIEEFVTRDGTDYGQTDVPLQRKIDQVMVQLTSGMAIIMFDESTLTCTIVRKDDPRLKNRSFE